jgi:hypothetical protein
LTGDQLNEMIAEIDTDSSGTVDFDGEFCLALLDFVVFYGFGFYPARRTKFLLV